MKRIIVILAVLLFASQLMAVDSTTTRIRLPGSGYTAILVGQSGYQCAGDTATGSYNSTFQAHEFYLLQSGMYKLYWDPAGGTSWSEVTAWSGTIGKYMMAPDLEYPLDIFAISDADTNGLIDSLDVLEKVNVTNATNYILLTPTKTSLYKSKFVAAHGATLIDSTAWIISTTTSTQNRFKTLQLGGTMTYISTSWDDTAGTIGVNDSYGGLNINMDTHEIKWYGTEGGGNSFGPEWILYNDDAGNEGVYWRIGKESASPASGDTLGVMFVDGKDDAANTGSLVKTTYLSGAVTNNTESAYWKEETKRAGSWQMTEQMNTSGVHEVNYKTRTVRVYQDTLGETFSNPTPEVCFADTADANQRLFKYDADSSRHGNFGPMMDLNGGSAGDSSYTVIEGYVAGFTGLAKGSKVWVSTTAGQITCDPDTSSGKLLYPVGHALSPTEIWFKPALNWSEK